MRQNLSSPMMCSTCAGLRFISNIAAHDGGSVLASSMLHMPNSSFAPLRCTLFTSACALGLWCCFRASRCRRPARKADTPLRAYRSTGCTGFQYLVAKCHLGGNLIHCRNHGGAPPPGPPLPPPQVHTATGLVAAHVDASHRRPRSTQPAATGEKL
jgi:hypothetical protein